jgi:chemotaxis response regulator CheB
MKGNKVNRFVAKVDGSSLVVTIGANSGGLKAMTALLHKLPRKTGLEDLCYWQRA